ncbi:MAG: PP2C family protein-serine/threonine phosphatase [Gammaproteobacteria bacterium]
MPKNLAPALTMADMLGEARAAQKQLQNMLKTAGRAEIIKVPPNTPDDPKIKISEATGGFAFNTSAQGEGFRYSKYKVPQQDAVSCELVPPTLFLKAEQLGQCLKDAVLILGDQYKNCQYGSTLTTSVIRTSANGNREIITANVGDSRAILVIKERGTFIVKPLNYLHKPDDPKEKKRIESAGGFVVGRRINASLAVSRAIGDANVGNKLSYEPGISYVEVPQKVKQVYLILCSDGITDELKEHEIAALFNDPTTKSAMLEHSNGIADYLRRHAYQVAYRKGEEHSAGIDNMSIIVTDLVLASNELKDKMLVITVADGHGENSHELSECLASELPKQLKRECSPNLEESLTTLETTLAEILPSTNSQLLNIKKSLVELGDSTPRSELDDDKTKDGYLFKQLEISTHCSLSVELLLIELQNAIPKLEVAQQSLTELPRFTSQLEAALRSLDELLKSTFKLLVEADKSTSKLRTEFNKFPKQTISGSRASR